MHAAISGVVFWTRATAEVTPGGTSTRAATAPRKWPDQWPPFGLSQQQVGDSAQFPSSPQQQCIPNRLHVSAHQNSQPHSSGTGPVLSQSRGATSPVYASVYYTSPVAAQAWQGESSEHTL